MNGGQLENASVKHHLCELTENAQLTAQSMKDGIRLSALVWMDFSESMVLALHVLLACFTTALRKPVKTYVASIKSSTELNVFANKIFTESTQYALNVL